MHIALVTPYFPTPTAAGGRTRIARLSSALAQQGQVHLFSALEQEDLAAESRRCGGSVEPYARVVTSNVMKEGVRGPEPLRVRQFPRFLGRALAASHDASPFDVVVVMHSWAGAVLDSLTKATVVLDEPELESSVELRELRKSTSRVVSRLMAYRRWQHVEREMWSKVDAITVARPRDLSTVRAQRPDTGVLVPDGVDAQRIPYLPPSRRKGDTVLFVGTMDSPSLLQGAKELTERVLPRLRARVPDATLTLAGPVLPREVRTLEGDNVRVASGMSNVASLLRDHAVFAVPQALAADGVQGILEPMAHGMPVVAPRSALRDFPLVEERHFLGIRSSEDLADKLAGALEDRSKLDDMAFAARRVTEQHDWQILGERFLRVIMAAVARKTNP